ncbi:hypothetical protein EV361DRAFT_1032403 [Lentinula raphanica]|nr:hypothetical protein EV361DRAFT_1032403 [Lentinula raphanica]
MKMNGDKQLSFVGAAPSRPTGFPGTRIIPLTWRQKIITGPPCWVFRSIGTYLRFRRSAVGRIYSLYNVSVVVPRIIHVPSSTYIRRNSLCPGFVVQTGILSAPFWGSVALCFPGVEMGVSRGRTQPYSHGWEMNKGPVDQCATLSCCWSRYVVGNNELARPVDEKKDRAKDIRGSKTHVVVLCDLYYAQWLTLICYRNQLLSENELNTGEKNTTKSGRVKNQTNASTSVTRIPVAVFQNQIHRKRIPGNSIFLDCCPAGDLFLGWNQDSD